MFLWLKDMRQTMLISVVICTYNRSESLKETLESLLNIDLDGSFNHEILVVDNNSHDDTSKIVKLLAPKFQASLRYIFEKRQGKCHALNVGISESKGEVIAFTDDDVSFNKDYLNQIARTFRDCGPAAGFAGGKIIPRWMGEKPDWVYGPFLGPLALLDYGDQSLILNAQMKNLKSRLFYGANLIVRKKLFDKHGGFDLEKKVAEDTEICLRFYAAGEVGLYDPSVVVHHKVPVARTRPEYFYKWFFEQGKYRERAAIFDKKIYYPFGVPTWLIRHTIVLCLKSFLKKDQHSRIYCRCLAFFNLGQIRKFLTDKKKV